MDPSGADSPWPEWIRYTLSALAGAFVAVIAVVKAWAKVKSDAEDAKRATDEHGPRIVALESRAMRDDDRWEAIKSDIAEIKSDVKALAR